MKLEFTSRVVGNLPPQSMSNHASYTRNQTPISQAEFVACALQPAHSVTVEACAGSGKTWLLVGRMLRLLLSGATPGSILAITFTRKAAQEMQERLHRLLHELAVAEDALVLQRLTERGLSQSEAQQQLPAARLLYEKVLSAQPPLKVDTFHGWFWQILQRAPWRMEALACARTTDPNTWGQALTPSPQANLLEHTERLQEDAWQGFLRRAAHTPLLRQHYLILLEQCGSSSKELLRSLLYQRAEWWAFAQQYVEPITAALQIWPADFSESDPRSAWLTPAVRTWCQAIASSIPDNSTTSQTLRDLQMRCVQTLAHNFSEPVVDEAAMAAISAYTKLRAAVLTQDLRIPQNLRTDKQLKNMGAAQTEYESALHGLAAVFQTLEASYADWRAWQLNRAAWSCALAWLEEYQQRKAQQQAIDFADIEWHTRQLLQDERYCAYLQMRLDARYQHLLFDEFQDTNPLQWGIVQAWLAGYGADTQRPSVFLVGDPKQSIYRFRRAEPRLFARAREWLETHFAAQSLRTNHTWRNAQAVIDDVNQVFSILPEAQRPQDFVVQTTQRQVVGGLSGIYCHPLIEDEVAESGSTVTAEAWPSFRNPLLSALPEDEDLRRQREAQALVGLLQQVLPQLQILDGSATRSGQYRDVLILVRTRTHLYEYEQALQAAGIPFISDRRGGLLETAEVADLCALLRFLTDTHDDLALAHTLSTPIFAARLTTAMGSVGAALNRLALAQQQTDGTWWQTLQSLSTEHAVWAEIGAQLMDWQRHAGRLPVHDLLDRIYHQGQVLATYTAAAPGLRVAQTQANLRELLALALNLESGRYVSLARFVDELEQLRRASTQEAPDEAPLAASTQDDLVRLLTVHAAKGLEAPLVLLPDASYQDRERGNGLLFDWPAEHAAPTQVSFVGKVKEIGPRRMALWASEQLLAQREAQNLLYVALTRAQHAVLVTGVASKRNTDNASTWYSQISAVSLSTAAIPASQNAAASQTQARATNALTQAQGNAAPSAQRRFDDLAWPLSLTQSLLALKPATTEPVLLAESTNLQLGTAWHAVLQRIRYADQVTPVLAALLPRLGLTADWAEQVEQAVRRVLCAPSLQVFFSRAARRIETELELLTENGELKRIDRLVELDEAYWLLDYKWQVTPTQYAEYMVQLQTYQRLLQTVCGHKPIHLAFITAGGELMEVSTGHS